MDERERRMTQNETLFREVNERVQEIATDIGGGAYEYVCECANIDCTYMIELTRAEYESLRADGTHFVVRPLHYTPEIETLVAEHESYWIVRKTGEAGDLASSLDPRADA
jgi:hypothetical protein